MRGELWKAAKEQVRKATSVEREAQELLQGELAELKEELSRKETRDSFKDITSEPFPEVDDQEPREPRVQRRPPPEPETATSGCSSSHKRARG